MSLVPLSKLRTAAREALAYVRAQPDVEDAEVFASANGNLTVRLNYTSHIPSNGVEEPKSVESYGLGLRAVFRSPEGRKIGFGSEPSDLSLEGARNALDKARRGAVLDNEFVSLPHALSAPGSRSRMAKYHDPAIMRIGNIRLLETGWAMVEKGLQVFQSSEDLLSLAGSPEQLPDLGLILGGDLVLLQERMAIASTQMPRVQTDESTLVLSFATAMVEEGDAKGSGWSVGNHLVDFTGESAADAARRAIESVNGQRVPGGGYRVILGPQAVSEILEWILLPGLQVDMVYSGASPFMGRFGQKVASGQLHIYDDGAAPGLAGSRRLQGHHRRRPPHRPHRPDSGRSSLGAPFRPLQLPAHIKRPKGHREAGRGTQICCRRHCSPQRVSPRQRGRPRLWLAAFHHSHQPGH